MKPKKTNPKFNRFITAKISEDQDEALDDFCQRRLISRSTVIRFAIDQVLKSPGDFPVQVKR